MCKALEGFEGNDYYFGGGNTPDSESSGVKIETSTNPASGSPIFIVESSGGSERLRVEHNGKLTTSNPTIEANGNTVYHEGNFSAPSFAHESGRGSVSAPAEFSTKTISISFTNTYSHAAGDVSGGGSGGVDNRFYSWNTDGSGNITGMTIEIRNEDDFSGTSYYGWNVMGTTV
ncbi:MAG: hypothetical protein ABEJ07_04940 [Candidatus Nanohaloarchaea archaeon]